MKKNIGRVCFVLEVETVSFGINCFSLGGVSIYLVSVVKDDDLVHTKHCCGSGDTSSHLSFELECLGPIIESVACSDAGREYNGMAEQTLNGVFERDHAMESSGGQLGN